VLTGDTPTAIPSALASTSGDAPLSLPIAAVAPNTVLLKPSTGARTYCPSLSYLDGQRGEVGARREVGELLGNGSPHSEAAWRSGPGWCLLC
jgi:hypothetical protein